jgi:TPR repeat protein
MGLSAFLPSLTNLPVFYAELVLLLLLFSVSIYALLHRLRTGPSDARPAVRLRTRLVVLLPAWVLWATWVGFGAYWLAVAGLVGGSGLFALLGVGAVIVFLLFSVPLIYWLQRAAASGAVDAQFAIAEHYLGLSNATGAQQERARHWLVTAADSGHREALRHLIAAYKKGAVGLDRDLVKAKAYGERLFSALEAASVLPNQGPWLSASWDYDDTLQQLKREREQYLPPEALAKAAQAGDPEAQYHLAREVLPRDFDTGIALLHTAADGGFAEAQYHAAHRLRSMKSTPESLRRAVRWLTAAVAQGHRGAMYELGTVYLQSIKDIGLARDPARARALFEQALDGGGEVLYRYTGRDGHGWIITAQQVERMLEQIHLSRLNSETPPPAETGR